MHIDLNSVKRTSLKDEAIDMVFNRVWEVTQMSWPEPIPEKMDRTKTRLIRRGVADAEELQKRNKA